MRYSAILIAILILCLLTPWISAAREEVILLDNAQIQHANLNGLQITQPGGKFRIWAWSLDTTPLIVAIDGKQLIHKPSPKANDDTYSWKNMGLCDIPSAKTIAIQTFTNPATNYCSPGVLGWLALSPRQDWNPVPEWNPNPWFELSRIYPNSVRVSDDKRLGIVRSKDHFYPFPHYENKRQWLERRQELKDHFLVSMGCYPMPPKTPLNPKVTGTTEYDEYFIDNVYFESMPGFFVTGNLYRPKGKRGPHPAILCPHGHWGDGILTNIEENSIPGRCINFARQGYIVFAIDMIGYNNSKQLTHKFGGPDEWLWGLTLHGLQFWNSVRAIDYLMTLDGVDKKRIAVTGASGGGTQTYGIMAADERVKFAAPVNMLSSHFQGGCLCENCANLRIDQNNVELGAMMAPRPLMMVSCTGDWTAETLRVEYPAIRSIYELYKKPERLGVIQIDSGHNYNKLSREAVYAFFGKWILGNDNAEEFKEQPFTVEPDKMKVFPNGLPDDALTEDQLTAQWKEMSKKQLASKFPENEKTLNALQYSAKTVFRHMLGTRIPGHNDFTIERIDAEKKGNLFVEKIVLGRKGVGDRIPAIVLVPNNLNAQGTLLVHCQGKDAWFDPSTGKPGELLQSLLDQGQTVLLADLFMTGEFNSPFQKAQRNKDIPHFLTYNQSETALRVQDILTALSYLQSRYEVEKVNLAGGGNAGLWALLAATQCENLNSIVIDAAGFNSGDDASFMNRIFVPGLRRAGDIRTAQALLAPTPLLIHNTGEAFNTDWALAAYKTVDAGNRLKVVKEKATPEAIMNMIKSLR